MLCLHNKKADIYWVSFINLHFIKPYKLILNILYVLIKFLYFYQYMTFLKMIIINCYYNDVVFYMKYV